MVDEREDRYEGEEGEYHFSDDQINYDELEAPKASQAAMSAKKSIIDRLSNLSLSRRMLLAGIVFVTLIGVVYKMLLPSSATLTNEIHEVVPAKKNAVLQQAPALKPAIMPASPLPQPAVIQPALTTIAPQITPSMASPLAQPAVSVQPMPLATTAVQHPAASAAQESALLSTPVPIPQNVTERVKAVEDHNAAMMNLLQTEYGQKMSDLEMQSNLVRGKMDEMAKRINRIETSLNQITQLLQQNAAPARAQPVSAESISAIPGSRSSAPRVTYTVQAIIPGRAWLKADSGDTVTVAEGDTLRDYGRISKIDPYDGVVEIDTGTKIIALSYGMSAE